MFSPPLPLPLSLLLPLTPSLWLAVVEIHEPLVPFWVMELLGSVFLYGWLFCVGACVGSFLNVVAYRLPRGLSLVHPNSFCPRCRQPIRLLDNIPIISWLSLGGRCRHCDSPISSRYFFVEAAVATIFLGVVLIETTFTGSLPPQNWDASRWLISPYETLPFWSTYALHVVLLTTLLGAALIDAAGFPTPGRILMPVVAAALALPLIWPLVMPDFQAATMPGVPRALGGWAVGLAIGIMVATVWWGVTGRDWPRFAPAGLFVAVGVVVGWRHCLEVAAASTFLFAAAMLALRAMRANVTVPLSACIFVAALPRLLELDLRFSTPLLWPLYHQGLVAAAWASIVALTSIAASALAPPQYFAPPRPDPPDMEFPVLPAETPADAPSASNDPPVI